LKVPLSGEFQRDNVACAVAALRALRSRARPMDEASLRKGLARVRWPGRLELIEATPHVLLDAAHNPDACAALARHVRALRERHARVVLLFGVLSDKQHVQMLNLLLPLADAHVFATPPTPRARPAAELAARFGGEVVDEPLRALRRAQRLAGKRGLVVVAGSIFLMAEVRAALLGKAADPPIAL
jgi:dihydrofolate synthase/folylpolyglutamate synthase